MAAITYGLFSVALCAWTVKSIIYESHFPVIGYIFGITLLLCFVINSYLFCGNKRIRQGMLMLAVFLNIRLSVGYCTWRDPHRLVEKEEYNVITIWDMWKSAGIQEVVLVIAVFFVVSILICHTKLFRIRGLNIVLMAVLPLVMIAGRLIGKKTGGSYLTVGGIMLFAIVLAGFPFVAATLLTMDENGYVGGNVKKMPWNLAGLLLYEGVLFFCCCLLNEYGLLLVIGVTGSLLFLLRCKGLWTKVFYSIACMASALFIAVKVGHISQRLEILA